MGNNLSTVDSDQKQNDKANCPLLESSLSSQVPLSRLREFYGSFKSVCDNLSIDLTEFEQIFGANESSFKIWDTDENGLIDALELFSGLTLMSDSSFEDKINFLFDLFDFNEVGVLTLVELEFMIDCCMNSIFKILKLKADVDNDNITTFINENFSENSEITKKRLKTWCSKCLEIQSFFKKIKKKEPTAVQSIKNPNLSIRQGRPDLMTIELLERTVKTRQLKPQCRLLSGRQPNRRREVGRLDPPREAGLDPQVQRALQRDQHVSRPKSGRHQALRSAELGLRHKNQRRRQELLLPQRVAPAHPETPTKAPARSCSTSQRKSSSSSTSSSTNRNTTTNTQTKS